MFIILLVVMNLIQGMNMNFVDLLALAWKIKLIMVRIHLLVLLITFLLKMGLEMSWRKGALDYMGKDVYYEV